MWLQSGTTILVLHPSVLPCRPPHPSRRLSEKTETSPCIWKKEDKLKILAYWIIMRFAELQMGGREPLSQVASTEGLHFGSSHDRLLDTGSTARQLSFKQGWRTDQAVLFIESQTLQSITPHFSSASCSYDQCALSVFESQSKPSYQLDSTHVFLLQVQLPPHERKHNRRLDQRQDMWCSTMVQCCFGNIWTAEKSLNSLD